MDPNSEATTGGSSPSITATNSGISLEGILEKYWKIISLLIILLVFGLGLYFFNKARKERNLRINGEKLVAASLDNNSSTAELRTIASDHPGTLAGGNALLLLAHRQIGANNSDYEEARKTLEKFVTGYKESSLYYDGVFALATLNEKEGDIEAAEKRYKEVKDSGKSTAAAAAALRLADILQSQGKLEDAITEYEDAGKGEYAAPFNKTLSSRIVLTKEAIELKKNPPPEPEPTPEEPAPTPEEPAPTPEEPAPAPEEPEP